MDNGSSTEQLVARIAHPENLAWAWRKARAQYTSGDNWCDDWSVAQFEANLDARLSAIGSAIADGTYKNPPIRPMGQPKKPSTGEPAVRQVFWIPVQSQVACLLPRPRETLLFRLWEYDVNDTTNDPPTIANIDDLSRLISKAQGILQKFQLTVPEGIPRQLVPRSLEQRVDWGNSHDAVSDAEAAE